MAGRFDISDYVQVNERLEAFRDRFPDGCMQSEIVTLTDNLVVVKAYAYRTPDDTRPGIGHSALTIPGTTPYTKGSELENAETSAWGRALAALGFEVKRSIASQEEVAMKQGPAPAPQKREATAVAAFVQEVSHWMKANDLSWSHPQVVAELGEKPAPTTLAEVANRWLVKHKGSSQLFMSRVGDRIRFPDAAEALA